MTTSADIAWPITALDFEASGLGVDTYPIEIGIARWNGPGTPIETWSSLVGATMAWRTRGRWDPESVRFHGIDRRSLDDAPGPTEVMTELNRRCGIGSVAFCDGGEHDHRWLQKLADAAGIAPRPLLGSLGHVAMHLDDRERDRMANHRAPHETAHRAGPDAVDHLKALAFAIGANEPEVVDWVPIDG